MKIGIKTFTEKELVGEAILATCKNLKGTDPINIGEYHGFKMELSFDSFKQEYNLTLKGKMSHRLTLGTDARDNITRIDNALSGITNRLEKAKTQLDNLYHQEEAAKQEVGKPFPQEAELTQKSSRLAELDALLNMDDKQAHEEVKEEKISVLAELKRHSDSILPDKYKPATEVSL